MKRYALFILIILLAITILSLINNSNVNKNNLINNSKDYLIQVPKGFNVSLFAENLTSPRFILVKDRTVFVGSRGPKIYALFDNNSDSKADEIITFIDGLDTPNSIDYYDGWYYIAETRELIRVRDDNNDSVADKNSLQKLVDLPDPGGQGHSTRTVKIHDNHIYFSAGSPCDVCYDSDPIRSKITKCDLDGKNCIQFAKGFRNPVGLTFNPVNGKLYASDNGEDDLGDLLPPDEINLIVDGGDYGWPICYGKNIHNVNFDKNEYIKDPCSDKIPTLINIRAHSAPLGLTFYNHDNFPNSYKGKLFVALHGPKGDRIIDINMNNLNIEDFAIAPNNTDFVFKPIDIATYYDGSMLVSDDSSNRIYRISYNK